MNRLLCLIAWAGVLSLAGPGCQGVGGDDDPADEDSDTQVGDAGTDDAGTDSETQTATATDGDADSDTDTGGVIPMDCTGCAGVGSTLEHMRCAVDLCDTDAVVEQRYETAVSLGGASSIEETYEAVARFGDAANDLDPMKNGSYAMIGTGPVEGLVHSVQMDDGTVLNVDPFAPGETSVMHDVFEWRLVLRAPEGAKAFRFKYVFFSEEYDEFIGSTFNDKFYVFLESAGTGGERKVINFTECRNPLTYNDFTCGPTDVGCVQGQPYCYIAINSAFSECCWYGGCPSGTATTDISGTGYTCAADQGYDSSAMGSSTGWLQTSWPISENEVFALTFHVHDTSDGVYDSQVILDAFEFLTDESQGTVPVE